MRAYMFDAFSVGTVFVMLPRVALAESSHALGFNICRLQRPRTLYICCLQRQKQSRFSLPTHLELFALTNVRAWASSTPSASGSISSRCPRVALAKARLPWALIYVAFSDNHFHRGRLGKYDDRGEKKNCY
jgi:hypothetical protein